MGAMKWLSALLLTRRTAMVVSILASVICVAGFLLYFADKTYAAKDDEAATGRLQRASRVIAVGTRSKSDFEGVHYRVPPILTICPRSDGKWDGSLTWGGAKLSTGPRNETLFRVNGPDIPHGELIIILPKSTTDIHDAPIGAEIVDVLGAEHKVYIANLSYNPWLKVTERGAHTEVSFNPFAGYLRRDGVDYSLSTIEFTLPSFEVGKDGFGSWDFEMPFMYNFPGELSPGLGSAEFDPGLRSASALGPASNMSGLMVRLCRKDAALQAEFLDPPPVRVGSAYEWLAPVGDDWQLTGRVSGGKLRKLADASLSISVTILGALIGALYGIALTKNTDEYKSGRTRSAPSVPSGRARQEGHSKSQVERSAAPRLKTPVRGSEARKKPRRR